MPIVAIPALAVIIVALLALVFLLAWARFVNAIEQVMPNWHIPTLGSLRQWIIDRANDAYVVVARIMAQVVHPIATIFTHPILAAKKLVEYVTGTLSAVFGTLFHVVNVLIPGLRTYLSTYIENVLNYLTKSLGIVQRFLMSLIAAAEARVMAYAGSVLHYLEASLHIVETFVLSAIAAAEARVNAYATNILHYLSKSLALVEAALVSAIAAAEHRAIAFATAALADARNYAFGLYRNALDFAKSAALAAATAAVTALDREAFAAVTALWPTLVTDIDSLVQAAEADFTDVVSDIRTATRTMPRTLTGTATATLALAIPLVRLAGRCTVPNCRNLSKFGSELQGALGIVEGGLLIALLAEVAANPSGAADEIVNSFAAPINAAHSAFASLVGVG